MSHAQAEASRDRLLIVEDDAAQRVGLQKLLSSWGYNVDVARDGREALEKITQDRPTIVLSDLIMPDLSGLELLAKVKQDGADVTISRHRYSSILRVRSASTLSRVVSWRSKWWSFTPVSLRKTSRAKP